MLDDPFARKLATILGSFGHQTRAVEMQGTKATKMIDYLIASW